MSTESGMKVSGISPAPTAEEAAAIMAGIEALWPRPIAPSASEASGRSTNWRFSGRWWASNHVVRRGRPGR